MFGKESFDKIPFGTVPAVAGKYVGAQPRSTRYVGTRTDAQLNLGSKPMGW